MARITYRTARVTIKGRPSNGSGKVRHWDDNVHTRQKTTKRKLGRSDPTANVALGNVGRAMQRAADTAGNEAQEQGRDTALAATAAARQVLHGKNRPRTPNEQDYSTGAKDRYHATPAPTETTAPLILGADGLSFTPIPRVCGDNCRRMDCPKCKAFIEHCRNDVPPMLVTVPASKAVKAAVRKTRKRVEARSHRIRIRNAAVVAAHHARQTAQQDAQRQARRSAQRRQRVEAATTTGPAI